MKDVIKMLKVIEKDLARVIKLVDKAPAKITVPKKAKSGPSKASKIRELLAKGKKVPVIALKLGVAESTVYAIKAKDKKAKG